MSFLTKSSASSGNTTLYDEVENPGAGDCGFYAFAIGLINVIQRELMRGNKNPRQLQILNQWMPDDKKYNASDFIRFNYRNQNRKLLDGLMSSLRNILHSQYKQDLVESTVTIEGTNLLNGNLAYNEFLAIFYYYHQKKPFDYDTNLLYASKEVRTLALDLSVQLKEEKNAKKIERIVQQAFLRDIFGDDYLDKIDISWDAIFPQSDEYLSAQNRESLLLFKQFKMVVEDFYNNKYSTRVLAPNFKLRKEAIQCAREMKRISGDLHQRVEIVVDSQALNQDELVKGTLYLQVDAKQKRVQVYSTALDKGYPYSKAKAEGLIKSIQRLCPQFKFENKSRLTIENSDWDVFQTLSITANDTFDEHILFKMINKAFLKIFSQEQFMKSPEALDVHEQKALSDFSQLLETGLATPLSHAQKQPLRLDKSTTLLNETAPGSKLLGALSKLKLNGVWRATHQDLNYLSELFEVYLENLENGQLRRRSQGPNVYNRPTITINNLVGFHWNTQIQIGYGVQNSAEKYADWCYENLPLSKKRD